MILAIPEYSTEPTAPSQWDRYYNTVDDTLYIQTLDTTDGSYPTWVEIGQGASVRDSIRRDTTLTRTKYAGKDFNTFLDEIISYVKLYWGDKFNDFMSSDAAIMTTEYISAALDTLSWYLDREMDDHFMETCRIVSSIGRLARQNGYKPQSAVAASADVLVTLTNGPYSFPVTIKTGHQFQGPNSLIFELGSDQVIPAGDLTKTIGVYQGKTYTESFISTGLANQIYSLSKIPSGEFLAQGKTVVTVNLDSWTENDFISYGSYDIFELEYTGSPPKLRFGDGVIGNKPPIGSEIKVSYVSTRGKSAGLVISGNINKSLTPLVVNFQTIPVMVTNILPATPGGDVESIESIRANAPRYFLAADRLVTSGDYDALSSAFSSISGIIAKAKASIVRGISDDLELLDLLDEVTSDRVTLDGYLDSIIENQTSISGITGSGLISDSIRNSTSLISIRNIDIAEEASIIGTGVITADQLLLGNRNVIETAQTRLGFLPYQEVIGYGDGSTLIFGKTLAMKPIRIGSVSIITGTTSATKTGTNGDCDAVPGRLVATVNAVFASTDVGCLIRIGGEFRQIQKYVSTTTIEYSGPRIYGTSLLVDVFGPMIVGYDSGGNITGTGITGTVSYTSGAVSVTFAVAPGGVSGKYGTPIFVTYQYTNESIQDILDEALLHSNNAQATIDGFYLNVSNVNDVISEVNGISESIDSSCDSIDILTAGTSSISTAAKLVPIQIQNDIDSVKDHLDEVLSSSAKANIVRVSCLTLDNNGFYTAPSQALKDDLKSYLDARKIVTVQNSIVGGEFYLVKVRIVSSVKISDSYVFQTVSAAVQVAIDNMLKGRDYGEALKRSEYYGIINDIDGVEYHNTVISEVAYVDSSNTGTVPVVDSNGNLFVSSTEIITKWDVSVTQIGG